MAKRPKRAEAVEPVAKAGFFLVNHEKLDRAINGSVGKEGKSYGGVGKDASDAQVLAEYDRLAGLILDQNNQKVANGSFFDFEEGAPRAEFLVKLAPILNATGAPRVSVKESGGVKEKKGRSKKQLEVDEEE